MLSFGYTIYSISIVITAFMGGLAIGSVIGGRIADRVRDTVLAYGLAEVGIGGIALATYPLLIRLPDVIAGLRDTLSIPYYGFSPWTFLIAMGVLLPPTILMGLTLPLLARALTKAKESAAIDLGSLYAVNTTGAALGSIVTGFLLIAFFGVYSTLAIAASINIIVGVAAIGYKRAIKGKGVVAPIDRPASAGDDKDGASVLKAPLFWAFGISGFAALACEVVWIRLFSPYLENSTYAFSLILCIFLLGIAAGGWAGRKAASRFRDSSFGFGVCQVLTGFSTGVGLALLMLFVQYYSKILPQLGLIVAKPGIILEESFWICLILIPSTFFMGAGFPFIAQWVGKEFKSIGGRTGKLYAANTVGSILGALIGGFFLLPLLGTRDSLVLLTLLFFINGGFIIFIHRRSVEYAPRKLAVLAVLLLVFEVILRVIPDPNRFAIRNAYKTSSIVAYREDPDVNVTLLARGGDMRRQSLHINLREVSGTGVLLTPWMVHLPLMLQGEAPGRRILNIGLGIGHTFATAMTHYTDLNVDVLELVPSVVDLFREFNPLGEDLIKKERGRVVIGDGRNYLLSVKEPYDVVVIDPTPPLYGSGAVNLYTADFFGVVKEKLTEKGILLLRIPYSADKSSIDLLLKTAVEVFPHVSLWKPPFSQSGFSVVASAHDYDVPRGFLNEKVKGLDRLGERWKEILEASRPELIGNRSEIEARLGDVPVVTDDHPYLEFPLFYK